MSGDRFCNCDFTISRLHAQLELAHKRESELEELLRQAKASAESYRVLARRTIQTKGAEKCLEM